MFTYGFYNSYKGDRKYDAEQISEIFDGILKDGIIPSYGQLFDVNTANNGMQITVGTGRAWFDHTWSKNDSVMVLTVPQSDITRPRYDAVVLEVNHEPEVRENVIKIVSGVAAVNATKPILVNTERVHQYPLAYILVPAAAESIAAEDIENMVGRSPTVFATGILETVAIDDLWSQWEGEWHTWFDAIKLQLSGDIVANLQYQIDELKENIKDINTDLSMIIQHLAKVNITVLDADGSPVGGVFVEGIDDDGIFTNSSGIAHSLIEADKKVTVKIQKMADITPMTQTIGPFDATTTNDVSISVTRRNFVSYSASNICYFSEKVNSVDFTLCGGGGGGAGGILLGTSGDHTAASGGGGGGGSTLEQKNISISHGIPYQISIGTGGSGGSAYNSSQSYTNVASQSNLGKAGGDTSFDEYIAEGGGGGGNSAALPSYTAVSSSGSSRNGGRGGTGSISSESVMNGHSGSNAIYYTSFVSYAACSGGGGGGYNGSGGSPNGGNCRRDTSSSATGTSPGGGGGGGTYGTSGGSGGSGICAIRMR